jgi:homospermidine synthase
LEFRKKVLILGYGAVAKCTLPILLRHVKIPYDHITILDFEDKEAALAPWIKKGIRYFRRRITPENLEISSPSTSRRGGSSSISPGISIAARS